MVNLTDNIINASATAAGIDSVANAYDVLLNNTVGGFGTNGTNQVNSQGDTLTANASVATGGLFGQASAYNFSLAAKSAANNHLTVGADTTMTVQATGPIHTTCHEYLNGVCQN